MQLLRCWILYLGKDWFFFKSMSSSPIGHSFLSQRGGFKLGQVGDSTFQTNCKLLISIFGLLMSDQLNHFQIMCFRPEQRRVPDVQRLPVGQGQDMRHERLEDRQLQVQDHRGPLQGDLELPRAHRRHQQRRQDHAGGMGECALAFFNIQGWARGWSPGCENSFL